MESWQTTRAQRLKSQTQQQQRHKEKLLQMMELLKRTQATNYFLLWLSCLILLENSPNIPNNELHSLLIFADMKTFLEKNAWSWSKRKRYVSHFKNWTRQAMTDIAISFYLGSRVKFYSMKSCKF